MLFCLNLRIYRLRLGFIVCPLAVPPYRQGDFGTVSFSRFFKHNLIICNATKEWTVLPPAAKKTTDGQILSHVGGGGCRSKYCENGPVLQYWIWTSIAYLQIWILCYPLKHLVLSCRTWASFITHSLVLSCSSRLRLFNQIYIQEE